jgi:hypothetical protein
MLLHGHSSITERKEMDNIKYKTKNIFSGSHTHPKQNHAARNKGEATDCSKNGKKQETQKK